MIELFVRLQQETYTKTCRFLMPSVINGYNATVFAYGATGESRRQQRHPHTHYPRAISSLIHVSITLYCPPAYKHSLFSKMYLYLECTRPCHG